MTLPAGFEAWQSAFTPSPRPFGDSRDVTATAFSELLRLSGCTAREFANALSRAVGKPISADMVEAWCDPIGSKPLAHWFFTAVRLVERARPGAAVPVLARFLA